MSFSNNMDKLDTMFLLRREFMEKLRNKIPDSYPNLPLDLTSKADQQFCRDMMLRGVEEMFEALQELKNWKPHRKTEVEDFDKDKFLEEIVDAFNYFFSIIIMTDYSANELYDAYVKKDKVIHERLDDGY
jgi:hypothetical protein